MRKEINGLIYLKNEDFVSVWEITETGSKSVAHFSLSNTELRIIIHVDNERLIEMYDNAKKIYKGEIALGSE